MTHDASPPLLVLTTFPDEKIAAEVARVLVEARLAACVNLVPGVRSVYAWEGAVQDEREVLGVIKTTKAQLDATRRALLAAHPYDTPEFVALDPASVEERYLAWWQSAAKGPAGPSGDRRP